MLFSEQQYAFMYKALMEAERAIDADEVPIGAVIVHENRVIGTGYNMMKQLNDPTAHAEMIAITAAANHLNSQFLENCALYVTLEPCVMCTGAILLARIKTVYFAAFEPKTGAMGSVYNIAQEKKLNHSPEVFSGLYEKEASEMLKKYFKLKRIGN